jgi:hypothetical protein
MSRLFHVSDRADIARFDPRDVTEQSGAGGQAVWAIDETHLPNYLLPRDCPRVCFASFEKTTAGDRTRYLTSNASRVIAIEWDWFERVRTALLYNYEFIDSTFALFDANAGYYLSREVVTPIRVYAINDLLLELEQRNIELRVLNDLWPLHDAVATSSLEFSMIRMRNAKPRVAD